MNSPIRERPILFSAPMVRAILAGAKTHTRRVVKPQPPAAARAAGCITSSTDPSHVGVWWWLDSLDLLEAGVVGEEFRCHYGHPGDRLWVRESWAEHPDYPGARRAVYRADPGCEHDAERWRPSIHMPRWASRITLEITDVRVQRLQEISEEDAVAEGVDGPLCARLSTSTPWRDVLAPVAVHAYAALWDEINGPGAWLANPWVWAISFKRLEQAHG